LKLRPSEHLLESYFLFKSGRLSSNIKITHYEALIRSVMTFACPARELAVNTHFLKLQRMQNKVLRNTGNFPRCTSVRDVCNYITKVCRQQLEAIQITKISMFAVEVKAKPDTKNVRGLNLVVFKLTTVQATKLPS
jgi:hypothetical protein